MACGFIPDPYYRDNEFQQMWMKIVRPKHLLLNKTELSIDIWKKADREFLIKIDTKYPAFLVWFHIENMKCKFSGNFFDLMPQTKKCVGVKTPQDMELGAFREKMIISSLADTY